MNLAAFAGPVINAVNPTHPIVWKASTGYTVDEDGKQVPSYATPVTLTGQIQPMQFRDLQQIDSLNLQGTRRKVYLFGIKDAIVRSLSKGGDLLIDDQGVTWLVAMVIEQWSNEWCSVAVTLQTDT